PQPSPQATLVLAHVPQAGEEVYHVRLATSAQYTIANLSSLEMVSEDARSSGYTQHIPQLADFGDQTWLWDPVRAVKTSFPGPLALLLELALAWRLVDQVTMQAHCQTACMTSVPMLDPLIGFTSPECSMRGESVALGALSSKMRYGFCPLRMGSV
ncbi:MAG: hypothetical protein ACKPKO_11255, partial [Candidatus Fonsibacter sp.]